MIDVAETLSFSSGSFNLGDPSAQGTEKLAVVEQDNGGFLLANNDGSTIKGLDIQGDSEPLNLEITSESGVTLKNATISLGDEGDTLIISGKTKGSDIDTGKSKDKFTSGDVFKGSDLETGKGKDKARFSGEDSKYVAKNSSISMGAGNDKAIFNGAVQNVSVDLGTGEDTLIFGGDIKGALVNLGSDGQIDIIYIADDADFDGLTITGADKNYILFIGSTEYSYEGGTSWVNVNNPNDVRNF